jgi:hypothetical protein
MIPHTYEWHSPCISIVVSSADKSSHHDKPEPGRCSRTHETASHSPDGYRTLAQGELTPRHRRLAQLAAQGLSNKDICAELGYSDSRVSILLKNSFIAAEVRRLQDRIFEATIKDRLKGMGDAALNNIEMILNDRTNRVRVSEKAAMSQWLIEKLDGKATQTHDLGQNMLGVLMDRLDAQRSAPIGATAPRDVTPLLGESTEPRPRTEEDELTDWVTSFNSVGSSDIK